LKSYAIYSSFPGQLHRSIALPDTLAYHICDTQKTIEKEVFAAADAASRLSSFFWDGEKRQLTVGQVDDTEQNKLMRNKRRGCETEET
jgi:hypothetical protein